MVCLHGCVDSNNAAWHQARSRGTRVIQCIPVVLSCILVLYDCFVGIWGYMIVSGWILFHSRCKPSRPTLAWLCVCGFVCRCVVVWENRLHNKQPKEYCIVYTILDGRVRYGLMWCCMWCCSTEEEELSSYVVVFSSTQSSSLSHWHSCRCLTQRKYSISI